MPKSLRLSGKFTPEEAEIIKKFTGFILDIVQSPVNIN